MFKKVLAEHVQLSSEDSKLDEFIHTAELDSDNKDQDKIDYKSLFTEVILSTTVLLFDKLRYQDDEGKSGSFLECLKSFRREQKENYIKDITDALNGQRQDNWNRRNTTVWFYYSPVGPDELKVAITQTNPEIEQVKLVVHS